MSQAVELGDVQVTIDRLCAVQDKVFSDVNKNITSSQAKQKEQYKCRKGLGQVAGIKEGNVVLRLNMVKRTKKGHKSEDTWTGP